jgi:hypothetical protein
MSFPRMFYASDGRTTIVTTQAEQDTLSGAWFDSPADFGLVTAPSASQTGLLTTVSSTGVFRATANATSYAPNGVLLTSIEDLAT